MSSKVVEANVGIHTLAMAVAVRPRPTTSFCCRHRRSMEASVPNCVSVKPLSSLSRAGACTVRLIFFFRKDCFVISACQSRFIHSFSHRVFFVVLDSIYTERYMNLPALNPGGYINASISNVTAFDNVDYLLAHGSGDDNVHFANSAHLLDMFTKAHIRNFRFRMFTDR